MLKKQSIIFMTILLVNKVLSTGNVYALEKSTIQEINIIIIMIILWCNIIIMIVQEIYRRKR